MTNLSRSTDRQSAAEPKATPVAAMPTYGQVKDAVLAASELTPKVRMNLLRAVDIAIALIGRASVNAAVDIPGLQRKLEKTTPAMLGFASANSFSAFQSNLRRALRIAGVAVMPGKSRTPLAPSWRALRERAEQLDAWAPLSRFCHFCSELGIAPDDVRPGHVVRFVALVRDTSLKSRADKTERQVTKAWARARSTVPGWPQQPLPVPAPRRAEGCPPWSAYPPSLEADARAFVARGADDWLEADGRPPLKPRTRSNYTDALRRAAGELVASGIPAGALKTLADLVAPDRVKAILSRVAERTGRRQGGHVGQLAIILRVAASGHVRLPVDQQARLDTMEKATRAPRQMGDRTLRRLEAMTPERVDAFIALPRKLDALARKRGKVDITSARLVRAALFISLLLELASRQGNVTELRLGSDIIDEPDGRVWVIVTGCQVKNGEEIRAELSSRTAALFRRYVKEYRLIHAGGSDADWLFCREDGSHWPTDRAYETVTDLTAWHIGVDLNPHAVRSLVGEILEAEHPGAVGLVKDVLGHKTVATTETHYRRLNVQRSRKLYHQALERRGRGRRS